MTDKVVLIISVGDESNNVIGIASTLENAYVLLGKSTEKAPWSGRTRVEFYEVEIDQDFVASYEARIGKLLNPPEQKQN